MTTQLAMGVYERSLAQHFKTARSKAPCVLVFDCIEDVVPRGSSGKSRRHVAAMKRELDALRDARVFVLALSASCERIASRVEGLCQSACRLGLVYRIGQLDRLSRRACLFSAAATADVDNRDTTLEIISRQCRGFTLSDLWALVAKARYTAGDSAISCDTLLSHARTGPLSRKESSVAGASWVPPRDMLATARCPLAGAAWERAYSIARRTVLEPLLIEQDGDFLLRGLKRAGGAVFYGATGIATARTVSVVRLA